jgi:dTDP-4-dehydrorhamnose reductase
MKKILILGARGMLGYDLVRVFSDMRPTAWDREELDLTDAKSVRKALRHEKPEVVINAAAYTAVDDCETSSGLAMEINGDAVGTLADVCADIGAILVHFSTDYVFDGMKTDGYAEDDPTNPINAYGQSKVRGEHLLREATTRYYLVRSGWLFGRNGKNFVDTILGQAHNRQPIRVVDDQTGSPTYTVDLAKAVRQLVEGEVPFGVYHLTNSGTTTWYGLAKEIFRVTKLDVHLTAVRTADFPRAAARPASAVLNNTKLPALRPWNAALADYLTTKG